MLEGMLSHYRIKEPLGAGGMGEVYRVEDTRLEREVALKVLRPELAEDEERLHRFRREAQLLAALDHPGIVTVYSIEESDGVHFLTMQLVEGDTLTQLIPAGGMKIDLLLEIALPLTEAIAAAHERSVIHRDLKPSNIMRTTEGRIKILDFGLAKLLSGEGQQDDITQQVSADGLVVGTVPYMSPEQLSAETIDERTDIFALGVILFEMATGERPFTGASAISLISAILTKTPARIATLRGDFPEPLSRIVQRCLEKTPSDRTGTVRDLYKQLREFSAGTRATGSISTGSLPSRAIEQTVGQSIAVLPFTTLSSDPEDEIFADGIADEIISSLGRIPELKVAARTSSFSFKGKQEDLRTIGEKLGVRTVLEGTVRRAGPRLRVTTQLVNVTDGYQIWTERYDREMADIFDIQDEIARKIASRLTETLVSQSDLPMIKKGTSDIEAFTHYTQGRGLLEQRNETGLKRSIEFFRRAIERDPEYALAWTGLADALILIEEYGYAESGTLLEEARKAIDRALELGPNLAEAHGSWGIYLSHPDIRKGRLALEAFENATRINPNYAAVYHWESWLRFIVGQGQRGLEKAKQAIELNPLSPEALSNVALGYLAVGKPEAAIREARRTTDVQNDFAAATLFEATACYLLGRFDEAISLCRGLTCSWAPSGPLSVIALAEVQRGNHARVRELMEQIRETGEDRIMNGFVHAALGETEEAITVFESAKRWEYWPSISMLSIFGEELSPLRSDPRYPPLIRAVNDWWGMTSREDELTEVVR